MFKEIKNYSKLEKAFFLLFISICFQNVNIISFGSFGLKPYHLISFLFLPKLIKKNKITLPPFLLVLFLIYLIFLSFLRIPQYGFHSMILNYIFCLYILILVCTLGKDIPKKNMISLMKNSAIILLLIVIIKDLFCFDVIYTTFIKYHNHPIIYCFFGGGVNLEATWLSLFGIFFYNDKRGYLYSICVLIISVLYASRAGIIGSALAMIFLVFQNNHITFSKKMKKYILLFIVFIIGISLANATSFFDNIIDRFLNIGDEPGSIGRLSMWKYVIDAFILNPFGYGLGHNVLAIELATGIAYTGQNVHNLFFEMLLDGGIIGFIWFCSIIMTFFIREFKNFFKDPIVAFLFSYLALSLLQFRGGEGTTYFLIAVYLINEYKTKTTKIVDTYDIN